MILYQKIVKDGSGSHILHIMFLLFIVVILLFYV